jgi:hypothetical protein
MTTGRLHNRLSVSSQCFKCVHCPQLKRVLMQYNTIQRAQVLGSAEYPVSSDPCGSAQGLSAPLAPPQGLFLHLLHCVGFLHVHDHGLTLLPRRHAGCQRRHGRLLEACQLLWPASQHSVHLHVSSSRLWPSMLRSDMHKCMRCPRMAPNVLRVCTPRQQKWPALACAQRPRSLAAAAPGMRACRLHLSCRQRSRLYHCCKFRALTTTITCLSEPLLGMRANK